MSKMFTRFNPSNLFQRTDRFARQQSNPGMTIPIGPDSKFDREDERLKTFDGRWPANPIDVALLARTGMYYVGLRDATRCHFCGITISEWQPDDHPVSEHLKWAPNCPLLRRQSTRNVPIDPADFDRSLPAHSPDVCVMVRQTPSNSGRGCPGGQMAPAYPHYSQVIARVSSFAEWPKVIKHKIQNLADAGFFYVGRGDQVQCFSCGGGLKDWEDTDDPWEQHAIWHSTCKYLRLLRGKEYIEECMAKYLENQSKPKEQRTESISFDRQISVASSNGGGEIDDNNFCKVCFIEERNTVFLPCGHVVACAKCASSLSKCPVCRLPFIDVHRLYFS